VIQVILTAQAATPALQTLNLVMSVTATARAPWDNADINHWEAAMNFSQAISISRVIIAAAIISSNPAFASTGYDGHWNVQISSNRPNCPSGASFAIAVEKGQVASAGGIFNASGKVADTGNINVVLSSGIKRANGLGHLSAASGSGTWHGDLCSGTWTASRD